MSGQILTAVNVKYFGIMVWTTCSLVGRYRGFGRTAVSTMTKGSEGKIEVGGSIETLLSVCLATRLHVPK
jgi:hypothetical protein